MILIRLNNNRWLTRDLAGDDFEKSAALQVRINGERLLEESRPLGAEWVTLYDRGEQKLTLEFEVETRHANPSAAATALLETLPKAFTGSAELYVGSAEDGWVLARFSQAAVRATPRGRLEGHISRVGYVLVGSYPDEPVALENAQAGGALLPATVDGRSYGTVYGPQEAGTIDGGLFAETLPSGPGALELDLGAYG